MEIDCGHQQKDAPQDSEMKHVASTEDYPDLYGSVGSPEKETSVFPSGGSSEGAAVGQATDDVIDANMDSRYQRKAASEDYGVKHVASTTDYRGPYCSMAMTEKETSVFPSGRSSKGGASGQATDMIDENDWDFVAGTLSTWSQDGFRLNSGLPVPCNVGSSSPRQRDVGSW